MSIRRKKPIDIGKDSLGVNPRKVEVVSPYTFAPPPPVTFSPEEIMEKQKAELHQEQLDQKRQVFQQKNQQNAEQFANKQNQNYFSFLQNQLAKQDIQRKKAQANWGGNQLGNVVKQPNYKRTDYLEPVKARKV